MWRLPNIPHIRWDGSLGSGQKEKDAMRTKAKPLFFAERTYREHGHDHTEIRFFESEVQTLAHAVEQCTDNKIGYGDAATAVEMKAKFGALSERGFTHEVSRTLWNQPRVTIRWLHYDETRYCEPRIEVTETYPQMRTDMRLLEKVIRRAVKLQDGRFQPEVLKSPDAIRDALLSFKATNVKVVREGETWDMFWVYTAA